MNLLAGTHLLVENSSCVQVMYSSNTALFELATVIMYLRNCNALLYTLLKIVIILL